MRETDQLDSTNFLPRIGPLQDLLNCPGSVFYDQGFRVQGRLFQRWQIFARADISKRDAHISQKSAPLDPFNRRTPKQVAKLRFIKRQIIA